MNILLFLVLLFSQFPSEWIEYESVDKTFAILLPGEAQRKEQILDTSTGDILLNTIYLVSDVDSTENFLYLVNHHELNRDAYSYDSIDVNYKYLQLAVDDIVKSMNGIPLYSNQVYQDNYPAIEYRLSYQEEQLQVKGRIIMTPDNLYSLQAFTTTRFTLNKNMDYFISSFKFIK